MNARIRAVFEDVGARGWLHAVALDDPESTVEVDADGIVPLASVYKLPLLAGFCRLVDLGAVDPRQQLTLDPAVKTAGPTGMSLFADPVTASLRDLALSMMTASDNASADALLDIVGLRRLAEILESFGLQRTWVRRGTAGNLRDLQRRTGTNDPDAALAVLADNDQTDPAGVYEAAHASASTAREMTYLLRRLWSGELLSAGQTEFVRAVMHRQIFTQRLASGFPHDGVLVAGKTGTFGALRHEVGVVTLPGGAAYAIAVYTLTARGDFRQPRVDAAIGEAARLAVDLLR
ncbi:class A beta-lactamase-related serine hydrolase [Kribbella solani]|uniref:serine hydrolase n=1 Tax=Kribbella solani TaxID=236067 RepID=UPI0029A3DEAC|nr:serine hydrolase [Kribbella solani]MDX3005949.1 class A beta-lactamase-related serine hydrolase [Kribbella solani]